MIKISNLQKRFGKFQVLKNINLQLEEGNIVALLGPNACGKTTLIKSILGMVIPNSGNISVQGKEIKNDWTYRAGIGYMPQISRYPENMRVGQILEMIMDIRKEKNQALDLSLYDSFQLKDILNKKMATLSGGTRQKVSAHLAFLFNPPIYILDEPTAGLDPLSSLILKQKIMEERDNGKLILITSHVLSELDDVVNQVIYMQDGTLIFDKSIEQLKADTEQTKLADAIAYFMKAETILV